MQHHSIHPVVCVHGATNQNHVSVARVSTVLWVATGTHNTCGDHDVHFCRLLRHVSSRNGNLHELAALLMQCIRCGHSYKYFRFYLFSFHMIHKLFVI
jgi:hypothetical protein